MIYNGREFQDIQDNRRKLIEEKTVLISGNEEEVFKKKRKIGDLQDDIEGMHEKISNSTKIIEQFDKLNDLNSQLKTGYQKNRQLWRLAKLQQYLAVFLPST